MVADELDERRRVRLPVRRESFELLEDRVDARCFEQLDRVLGVLVEIRIENALIHEVLVGADIEQYPPEVMQLEWGQRMRTGLDRLLDPRPVGTDVILCAGLDPHRKSDALHRTPYLCELIGRGHAEKWSSLHASRYHGEPA